MSFIHTIDRKKNMNETLKHIFLCRCLRPLQQGAWGQSSVQVLLAASEAGFISSEMWSEEWWSEARGDGCDDGAIFSWLLLPLMVAVCVFACMLICSDFFFFSIIMQCSIWPWEEHVPEGCRERAEWMCDHFNLCVILDCTTSYLTTEQLSRALRTLLIQLFQLRARTHCRSQVWCKAREQKQVNLCILKRVSIYLLTHYVQNVVPNVKMQFNNLVRNPPFKTAFVGNLML